MYQRHGALPVNLRRIPSKLLCVRLLGVLAVFLSPFLMFSGFSAPTAAAAAAPTATPAASAAPAPSPYLLPWPRGVSSECVQGNNGSFSHTGVQAYAWDFAMPTGSVVEAARGGVVRYVRQDSNVGGTDWKEDVSKANYVVIDQGDGTSGVYLHLMENGALVHVGDHVAQGQPIAYSGATGFASGPHLHFQVEKTDPSSWFSQSLPVTFADVTANKGVPIQGGSYVSGNAPSSVLHAPTIVNITNAPSTPTLPTGGARASGLDAAFVSDVTFPDGSSVDGGQTFTKAWSLRNDGSQAWPANSHLALQGSSAFQVLSTAIIDPVPPGAGANVSVTLRAPLDATGTSEQQQWRLADSQGNTFGPVFWLRVTVGLNLPTIAVQPDPGAGKQYFPQTGHTVGWPFLQFYRDHSGLDAFGYPRTEAFKQDGLTVQYFQRARFEYHPELAAGEQVQLTLLGDALTKDQQPFAKAAAFASNAQHAYFPQTGHSVNYGFLQYFQSRGGVTVFGYPISEELQIDTAKGPATIQYFQRARFEYHPELAGTPYAVELGLLGDQTLTAMGWLPVPAPASRSAASTPVAHPAALPPTPATTAAVTPASVATPAPVSTAQPTTGGSGATTTVVAGTIATVATAGLRVHSDPGAEAPVISYLEKGNQVHVLGLSGGWAQVGNGTKTLGWVDSGFLAA
jgi:hypothetical protein